MNLNIKTGKNFTTQYNKMVEKYGEEFELLNGFHDTQMNYTDFIDNFTKDNISEVTIDANANATRKDICSLNTEKSKSHDKLLTFNKIFYEVQKKYGIEDARDCLEAEWSGAMYLHDAASSSQKPYCILPDECCFFILNGKKIYTSLNQIYELLDEKEFYDDEQMVFYKRPNNLLVLDYDKERKANRYTRVTMISNKETEKDFYFTKTQNGSNIITTEDHKIISKDKDVEAKDLDHETICYSSWDSTIFTNSIYEYNGLYLTEGLGYLVGMYLAEGFNDKGQMNICQSFEKSNKEWNKIVSILESIGIPYSLTANKDRIRLKNGNNNWERKLFTICKGKYCDEKHLTEDFVHFNDDFLKGFLCGMIDGDGTIAENRTCMIRLTSRILINQIHLIGLHFGVYFGSRIPYIQSQKARIQQERPMYSCCVNMNRNRDFFKELNSIKIQEKYTHFDYDERYANNNYKCSMGELIVRDNKKTYKTTNKVFDLSTETHTFICNEILVHNCYSYDLTRLANEGLFFLADSYNNEPPKHLDTFNDDFVEFVSWNANRTSGAVGAADYLIWSWYFWNLDKMNGKFWEKHGDNFVDMSDKARRQSFQKIVYRLNQPFLRVDQSAFTNFSIFDRNYLEELFGGKEFPDGTFAIDHIEDLIEHEKCFMEVYSEIKKKNFMTFPVITISLLYQNGKFVDEEFARWASKHNMQFNDSNFFVSGDIGVLSSCCRMQNDTKKIKAFINSIGGTSLSIGSVKVNTINLMRIALESKKNEEQYIKILKERIELCMKTLDTVRHIIKRNIEKGLLNNYVDGCIDMDKQFCSIGINAMYEAIEYFGYINTDEFGNKSYSDKGLIFASKILDTINELKDRFKCDYSWNCEAIPGEQAAKVLCRKDELLFNKPRVRPLYSNQWIPLMEKCTIQEKLRLGAILDTKCGGGQISHINLDKPFNNEESAWKMLNKIAQSGVIYFAFNTAVSVCKYNHGFYGNTCPICGKEKIDEYTRIVGFARPISSYSKERAEEYHQRKWFSSDNIVE